MRSAVLRGRTSEGVGMMTLRRELIARVLENHLQRRPGLDVYRIEFSVH